MFGVTRHLRVGGVSTLLLLLCFLPLQAAAIDVTDIAPVKSLTPPLIITELQTNGGLAAQEFIELYNTTDQAISLSPSAAGTNTTGSQWKLQFYGSALIKDGSAVWQSAVPSFVFSLKGTVQPHGYFIVTSTDHAQLSVDVPAEQIYSKSNPMTDSGGGLELVELPAASGTTTTTLPIVQDRLAWLDPLKGPKEGVLPTPAKPGSLQRQIGDDGTYATEDGSLQDFIADEIISPLAPWLPPIVETPVVSGSTEGESVTAPEETGGSDTASVQVDVSNTGLLPPYLTELLPNPASPLKDETDEFIELFNPNDASFNLKGYALEVGTTTLHDFTFTEDLLLAPGSYTAFYSKDTGLALTNSGGQARLLDTADVKLSESLAYGAADDGVVWAFANETWQWSTSGTPGLPNTVTAPAVVVKAPATASKATAKKAAAKPTTAKVKGASTTKSKAAAKKKAKKAVKPKVATVANISAKPPRAPIHTGVLAGVVAVALLYAAYEYRHDLSNRIHKLRGNRTVRAVAR